MGSVYLRIEIWRPYYPDNSLIQTHRIDEKGDVFHNDRLFEQIYCWLAALDVWLGLESTQEAQSFYRAITEDFKGDLPPEERSISKLAALLDEHGPSLDSTPLRWHDWSEEDDQDEMVRGQSIRAFLSHLRWLVRIYGRMPNTSVTIR